MFAEGNKNKFQHNPDGTTFIFIETKNKYFPGKHTIIIDTEDWDRVKEHSWCLRANGLSRRPYAQTGIAHPEGGWIMSWSEGRRKGRRTCLNLHHLILGKPPKGMVTDHINHNGLDNRKENLRFATHGQNAKNTRSRKNSTSQYLGVWWDKHRQMWAAAVRHNRKKHYLGHFTCEHQAALIYNKKAIELHGEFANLNVVPQEYIIKYNNV